MRFPGHARLGLTRCRPRPQRRKRRGSAESATRAGAAPPGRAAKTPKPVGLCRNGDRRLAAAGWGRLAGMSHARVAVLKIASSHLSVGRRRRRRPVSAAQRDPSGACPNAPGRATTGVSYQGNDLAHWYVAGISATAAFHGGRRENGFEGAERPRSRRRVRSWRSPVVWPRAACGQSQPPQVPAGAIR